MKPLLTILAALAMLAPACTPGRPETWPPVHAAYDSVAARLDSLYFYSPSLPANQGDISVLESISATNPANKALRWRTSYWRARYHDWRGHTDSTLMLLKEAQMLVDSAAFPYDHARIAMLEMSMARDEDDIIQRYRRFAAMERFFGGRRDSMMLVSVYMRLSHLMKTCGDHARALDYARRTDSLLTLMGNDDKRIKNLLNVASELGALGDTAGQQRLDRSLRENAVARADPRFYHLVLRNSFLEMADSLQWLMRAIAIVDSLPGERATGRLYRALAARQFLTLGQPDSARIYATRALADLDSLTEPSHQMLIFITMAELEANAGRPEAALELLARYIEQRDILDSELRPAEIVNLENRRRLDELQEQERRRESMRRLRLAAILAVAAMVLATVFVKLWSRIRTARRARELSEEKLRRSNSSMAASRLALEENGKLVEAMLSAINEMVDLGQIPDDSRRRLAKILKTHTPIDKELGALTRRHEEVHPDFARRLKADFPELKESQLKLALYIVLGLDNASLAQVMGVALSSVYMARYRLRQRLGLSKTASLEDFLRRYS